jgi:hypothetical protein
LLSLLFYFRFIQKSLTLKTESLPGPLSLSHQKKKKKNAKNEKKKKKQQTPANKEAKNCRPWPDLPLQLTDPIASQSTLEQIKPSIS